MIELIEFDIIFDEIMSLSQKTYDAAVSGRLVAAAKLVESARQMHEIIQEQGFDIHAIGLQEDRSKDRRQGERRLTR